MAEVGGGEVGYDDAGGGAEERGEKGAGEAQQGP